MEQLRDSGWRLRHMHFKGKVAMAAGLPLLGRLLEHQPPKASSPAHVEEEE